MVLDGKATELTEDGGNTGSQRRASNIEIYVQAQESSDPVSRKSGLTHIHAAGAGIMDGLFQTADLISSYTRAQALDDGLLIDVTATAREAGFSVSVALTRAAWVDCVEWTDATDRRKAVCQDESGRLWDVVYMAARCARRRGDEPVRHFELYRVPVLGRGIRPRLVALMLHIGPGDDGEPVITISLPGED